MNRRSMQLSTVREFQQKFTAVSLELPYLEVTVLHYLCVYVSVHVIKVAGAHEYH